MPKLSELGLGKETLDTVDFDTMPKQGGRVPLLQPGHDFTFQFPADLGPNADYWDTFQYEGKTYVSLVLTNLKVVQAPKRFEDRVGEEIKWRANNMRMERKRGDTTVSFSTADYLIKEIGGVAKLQAKPTNQLYIQELSKLAGKAFIAKTVWNWRCDKKRPAMFVQEDGSASMVEGAGEGSVTTDDGQQVQAGCGNRYSFFKAETRALAAERDEQSGQPTGIYKEVILCTKAECGARLYANFDLENFRPVVK